MSDDTAHCTVCGKDIPTAEFLKHFRECVKKNKAAEAAATKPVAVAAPAAPVSIPPATSTDYVEPDEAGDFAANMGMEAGDYYNDEYTEYKPPPPPPKPKRKKLTIPFDCMTPQQQRLYHLQQMKEKWRSKHMEMPPVKECGFEYLECYEEGGPGLAPCKWCRYYFPEHKLAQHQRVCKDMPPLEADTLDNFDPVAPIVNMEDTQKRKMKSIGQLESHEWVATESAVRYRKERMRLSKREKMFRDRERGYHSDDELLVRPQYNTMDRLPENPNWTETVPATLSVLDQVLEKVDAVRYNKVDSQGPRFKWDERRAKGYRQRSRERAQLPPRVRNPPDARHLEEAELQRQTILRLAKEDTHAALPVADYEEFRGTAPEAVLQGNAWTTMYYPYSDHPMLTDEIYQMQDQRQNVLYGMRAAGLYNMHAERQEVVRQVYEDNLWRRNRLRQAKTAQRERVLAEAKHRQTR